MDERAYRTNRRAVQVSSSSAGMSSPSQVFMGTSARTLIVDNGLTAAPRPWIVELELVFPLVDIPQVQAPDTAFKLERKWRRMAASERKKTRKKGFKPSDVEKEIGALRYRR